MKIRGEALELALRIVLSCPCDVTHEQERRVFDYLRGLASTEIADYAPVLAAFDTSGTPFHGLSAFTEWMAPAGVEPTIEREHVLRANSSSYHWALAAASLPTATSRVSSLSAWLLSHMIVPASLTGSADGAARASYRFAEGAVLLENVFLPPEFDLGCSELWAVHLGAIVGPLTALEAALVSALNEANAQLVVHRARVAHIDYADFELQGDYAEFCRRRHAPFWGRGESPSACSGDPRCA